MKRKYLLSGVIAFALIAIISTTFAAFIIGGGNTKGSISGPSIQTGEVNNKFVDMQIAIEDGSVKVDAQAGDLEGKVTASESGEDLEFSVKITVKGSKDNWTSVTLTPKFTGNDDGLFAQLDPVTIEKASFKDGNETDGFTYIQTFTLAYGAATKTKNPSIYLDEGEWVSKSASEVESELNRLLTAYRDVTITIDASITVA